MSFSFVLAVLPGDFDPVMKFYDCCTNRPCPPVPVFYRQSSLSNTSGILWKQEMARGFLLSLQCVVVAVSRVIGGDPACRNMYLTGDIPFS